MKQTKVYQAIHIKWLMPTNTQPSRYRAKASAGSLIRAKDMSIRPEENARQIAEEYCHLHGWLYDQLLVGQLYTGDYVAVLMKE